MDNPSQLVTGIGKDYQIYTRSSLTSWTTLPNSSNVLGVLRMPSGTFVGIGTDNNLYTRENFAAWELVGSNNDLDFIDVSVFPDGTILGVGADKQLYSRSTLDSEWSVVSNSGSVMAVAIMSGGSILGVGTDKELYQRQDLASPWVHIQNSGSVINVATLPDTSILGIGVNQQLRTRSTLSDPWVDVPNSGAVIAIGVLPKGTILGVGGADYQLYTRATLTSPWVNVARSGSVISVALMSDGTLLGVGTDKRLYTLSALPTPWTIVPNSGAVIAITLLQDNTILGIGKDKQLYTRATITSPWVVVPNSGEVIGVTQLLDGSLLGIGTNNSLYTRATLNSQWTAVANSGSVVSVAVLPTGTIVGVGTEHQLFTRRTLTDSWVSVPNSGGVSSVNVQPNGSLLGTSTGTGEVCTMAYLPSLWTVVPNSGPITEVMQLPDNTFMGIGENKLLYSRRNFSNWISVPQSTSVIGVATLQDGRIIGVGTDLKLYTRDMLKSPWILTPGDKGAVIGITILPNNIIVGIGTDKQLYTRSDLNSNWVNVPNSGSVIAITGLSDGSLLGVGTDQQLYTRQTLTAPWVLVPSSGAVIGVVSLLDGTIVGIGTDKELYVRKTLTSPWVHIPNSGAVIAVALLPDGMMLGVGTDKSLYTTMGLPGTWDQASSNISVVSTTLLPDGTILGAGADTQLYTRQNLSSDWVVVPASGSVIGVTTLPSGAIVGLGTDKQLYTRTSITGSWVAALKSSEVTDITALDDGTLLGVGVDQQVYRRTSVTKPWKLVPIAGSIISLTPGLVFPVPISATILNNSATAVSINDTPLESGKRVTLDCKMPGIEIQVSGRGVIYIYQEDRPFRTGAADNSVRIISGAYEGRLKLQRLEPIPVVLHATGTFSVGNIVGIPIQPPLQDHAAQFSQPAQINIQSNTQYDFGRGDFTIEAIFRTNGQGTVASRAAPSPNEGGWKFVIEDDGSFLLHMFQGTAFHEVQSGPLGLFDQNFHHVAVVRASGELKLYHNGSLIASRSSGSLINLISTQPIILGAVAGGGSPGFSGIIDDFVLWSRALSEAEIQPTMFNRIAGQGLVGYWALDDNLKDHSPIHNNASISGGVTFVPIIHTLAVNGDNGYSYCVMKTIPREHVDGISAVDSSQPITSTRNFTIMQGSQYLFGVLMTSFADTTFPAGSTLTITGPDGTVYNHASDTADLLVMMEGTSIRSIVVKSPQPGTWKAVIQSQTTRPLHFVLNTVPSRDVAETMMKTLGPIYYGGPSGGLRTVRSVSGFFDAALALGAVLGATVLTIIAAPEIIAGGAIAGVSALGALAGVTIVSHVALYVKVSSEIGPLAAANKLVGYSNFDRSSTTTVFVWSFRGTDVAWGHASMKLSDGTYISWWPSRSRFPLSPVKLQDMPSLSNIYESPAIQGRTYDNDEEAEEMEPDYQIDILGLDEAAIKEWWAGFKTTYKWRTLDQNCSTTVKDALVAGGAKSILSHYEIVELETIIVWKPENVVWLANKIAEHNPV